MSFWDDFVEDFGAPVGAGIGWLVGGPVGAAVGGSIGGGLSQSRSSSRASSAQLRAAREANQLQREMFQQQRADLEPWRQAGIGALGRIQGGDFERPFMMSDFMADPGYQFRLGEGEKAIQRAAAARGGLHSGATLKALTGYGQNLASEEFGNAFNRFQADKQRRFNTLASLAGLGQTAQSQLTGAQSNLASQLAANQLGMGNVRAAGHIARGNIGSSLAGNLTGLWQQQQNRQQQQQWFNRLFPNAGTTESTGMNFSGGGGTSLSPGWQDWFTARGA